jgi:hypothetical protein
MQSVGGGALVVAVGGGARGMSGKALRGYPSAAPLHTVRRGSREAGDMGDGGARELGTGSESGSGSISFDED